MKTLKDYQKEIEKCSKCGLCQSVCPVYKETGNDCAVSRGKFVMLDGVLKGDLELNRNINKYLDLCLKCGKCTKFCPSSIDICKIFETAKYEYTKKTLLGKLTFFLQSRLIFNNIIKMLSIPQKIKSKNVEKIKTLKLLYFKGCVGSIFPQTKNLLQTFPDIEIIEKDFECCGIPFLSSGNLERYEQVKQHNLQLINSDFDYIFTNCASCESSLKEYSNAKFINLGELIVKLNLKFKFNKPVKVTFHKPCHLENIDFLQQMFKNFENVEYVEMKDLDSCCGFAGEFALKNSKISRIISKKKAQNIIATNTDFVITTCPSCILGLQMGLLGMKNAPKVLTLTDFIKKATPLNF